MKLSFLGSFSILYFLILSCGSIRDTSSNNKSMIGNYSGDFKTELANGTLDIINLEINIISINNDSVIAENSVMGYKRPMTGSVKKVNNLNHFRLKEPGDHSHDGVFEFYYQNDSLIGEWNAIDSTIEGPYKTYKLIKD